MDTTERLHFDFSLSCIGEGNGNPLHCSCLENPKDRGAWWAAIFGVAESDTTEATWQQQQQQQYESNIYVYEEADFKNFCWTDSITQQRDLQSRLVKAFVL